MSQGQKRVIDQDPDYESIPFQTQQKRLKLHEQDAKDAAVKKIEKIVRNQFCDEISSREAELDLINKRIYQAQMMLDRLRVGIITKYYASGGQAAAENCGTPTHGGWEDSQQALASVHPTVRHFLGKAPPAHFQPTSQSDEGHHHNYAESRASLTLVTGDTNDGTGAASRLHTEHSAQLPGKEAGTGKNVTTARINRGPRCKNRVRVIVGNVSKYIPLDRRDDGSGDQATHKWLAYVRTAPEEPYTIGELVRHVRFFLHPSYRPHDLVEITEPPFQVQRKGWGEFPLRVQLHFHDRWTKHVDIIHHLKLDKTYTGLQTLGAETVVDLWLPASATRSDDSSTAGNDISASSVGMHKTSAGPDRKAVESASGSSNESLAADKLENNSSISMGDCKDPLPDDPTSRQHSETSSTSESVPIVSSASATEQPCSFARLSKTEPAASSAVADTEPCPALPVEVDISKPPAAKCSASEPSVKAVVQMPSPCIVAGAASSPVNVASKPVLPKVPAAVSSNGVISSTFVKCTDALGRVLLIPATSLLSASSSPIQQATVSQQSSLLQLGSAAGAGIAITGANFPVGAAVSATVPKPLGLVLASASSCTPSASSVNVTAVGVTSGAALSKGSTAIGIAHEEMPPSSSKIPGKSATITVVPSSVPRVASVTPANVISNVVTLPFPKGSLVATPGAAGGASVKKIVPTVRVIRPALSSSAAIVNRTVVPTGTLHSALAPTVEGTSGAGLLNSSSVVCTAPMSPSVKAGVVPAVANRTNLLSVICSRPAVPSVSASAPIVSSVSPQLVAIAPAAVTKTSPLSVICSKAASERTVVVPQVAPSAMPSASKVKSAPSTTTYTLVMLPGTGGGQGQVVLLPTSSIKPKDTVAAPVVAQGKQCPLPCDSPGSQVVPTVVSPAASLPAQPEKVDPVKKLQDRLDSIRLCDFKDMREALLAVVAHFPLVDVTECEKVSCFPYAATDGATYFSWPLPKRRASEWMRACDVRRTLQLLVQRQQPSWFLSYLPSRRSIVLLCRRFGFTPLHPDADGEIEEVEIGTTDAAACNSYSEPSELVSRLATDACAMEGAQDDTGNVEEEVDVMGQEAEEPNNTLGSKEAGATLPKQNGRINAMLHCDSSPEKCLPRKAKVHLPLSPRAAFIREAASEVGVHLSSCELEPRIDVPVVEEMIVSACKNFATKLMRSAVNMAFKRVSNERIPSVVTLEDTYRGILALKECSFLTNENLGIESTREGNCDDTHV